MLLLETDFNCQVPAIKYVRRITTGHGSDPDVLLAQAACENAANPNSAVLNPVPIPESILKKRKTADQAATDRKAALAERKKVSQT